MATENFTFICGMARAKFSRLGPADATPNRSAFASTWLGPETFTLHMQDSEKWHTKAFELAYNVLPRFSRPRRIETGYHTKVLRIWSKGYDRSRQSSRSS